MIAFSIGFELTLTNLFAILDLGGVPLRAADRGEGDPIVIAGGPAATNPAPLGAFLDAVFVGEAEGWLVPMFTRLAAMKRAGAGRCRAAATPCAPIPRSGSRDARSPCAGALWRGFGRAAETAAYPVPSMRVVQDHGTVEIMRGCPNACRFCHAASFYRPCRRKDLDAIHGEVADLVRQAGYREITLSSLSSGDYPGVHELVRGLNAAWGARDGLVLPAVAAG